MNRALKMALQIAGWTWIFVFVMIGVLGAGLHVIDHFNSIGDWPAVANAMRNDIYGKEFYEHWISFRNYPTTRLTHMVLGIAFMLLAPMQLMPRIRSAYPTFHRISGRLNLIMSFVLIATGLMFAFKYTYTGFVEQVPAVTYSIIYTWLIFMALKSILAGNVQKHREWMIRGFSMMMGISGTRVWFYLFLKMTDVPSTTYFSSIFWLGLGVNLLIAEIWINMTRLQASERQKSSHDGRAEPTSAGAMTSQSRYWEGESRDREAAA